MSCNIHICLFGHFILGLFRSFFVKLNSWKNRVFGDKISSCTDLQSYDVQCCMSSRFRKPVTADVVSVTVIPSSCFVWQFQILFLVCFLVVGTISVMRFLNRLYCFTTILIYFAGKRRVQNLRSVQKPSTQPVPNFQFVFILNDPVVSWANVTMCPMITGVCGH